MNAADDGPGEGQKEDTAASRAARDPIAKARHDLRNPLAHILGFSEMAMEKAQEKGFNHLKSRLEVIYRTASLMLEQINQGLDAANITAGLSDLPALQQQLGKLCHKIIAIAQILTRKSRKLAGDMFSSDLARIIGAAQRLLELTETCLPSLGSPAPPRPAPPESRPSADT